ncbi:MAG: hypothetical protein K2X80_07290 [Pseudomonadaceae bacterium]|nr:hypothetical protein [Pseudomonadaceae bacterium]
MYLFGKWFPLMAEEGEGGNGGGNEGDEASRIAAAVEAAVGGLKTKNGELLGKLKAASENAARFEGIDPDAVRGILSKFANDEEAGLIAAGKLDEVLNKRTERMKAGFEKETSTERAAREAADARADKFSRRVLENGIRSEATAAGLHQYAIDDALLRAGSTFTLDDEGNPVAKEGSFGKDGNPLTLKEWFGDMKDKAPHWFPATASGSGAGHGGGNGGNTMNQAAFDALSPKERAVRMAAGLRITG